MKLLICGKGGSGKSTVSALLALAMKKRYKQILLVDADESNIGLYRMLGMELPQPLMDHFGGKKGFSAKTRPSGMSLEGPPRLFADNLSMDDLPENCLASANGIKVMPVGKIHDFGEGCACPMGKLFRMVFSSLTLGQHDMVIVDTAAGVEHFGRSLDKQCDRILCVVDPSYESIMMAKKVTHLADQAGLPVSIILNKVTPQIETELLQALEGHAIIGSLPDHHTIFLNNLKGASLTLPMPEMESICDTLEKQTA